MVVIEFIGMTDISKWGARGGLQAIDA